MPETKVVKIAAFYEFKPLDVERLGGLKLEIKELMARTGVRGTVIVAAEGYNGMVCGDSGQMAEFLTSLSGILETTINYKASHHHRAPFRKIDVKIKPEIVTLKKDVDISLGTGTHVPPKAWNDLISDPETLVLDARNDYEYRSGTFPRAINPGVTKFSDLPAYVAETLDEAKHKRVAMFCTGGIRCEKFAPYLKQMGFAEVFQLEGGILKYLEEIEAERSLWQGECFVFDERVTVGHDLKKGSSPDHSQRHSNNRKMRSGAGE